MDLLKLIPHASLIAFMHDINQSLAALKLELEMEGLADV